MSEVAFDGSNYVALFSGEMTSEGEEQSSLVKLKSDENALRINKGAKLRYTRELLLSLVELDTCKRMPTGFDSSILREIDDCLKGSSLSSGGSESRQNPEKGLLGSGDFLRAPECISGAFTPKSTGNVHPLLNRSATPYRPPHFFKANLNSGRDVNDLNKNETFGSSDCPSQESLEEERRGTDSFEFLRMEHRKASEGKQKEITDEYKEILDPDIAILLKLSGNGKRLVNKCNEPEEWEGSSNDNSGRRYFPTQTSACRQLRPSGFTSKSIERDLGTKSSTHASVPENCNGSQDHPKIPVSSSFNAHQFLEEGMLVTENSITGNDILDTCGFPFRVDIHTLTSANGSIRIKAEGTSSSHHAKKRGFVEIEQNQSVLDDIQTKVGLDFQNESTVYPVSGFDEIVDSFDEICLPDEDTLITVDDYIVPADSVFMPNVTSVGTDLFAASSSINVAKELAALSVTLGKLEASYHNQNAMQPYPLFHSSQKDKGRSWFQTSESRETHMSHQNEFICSKTFPYNPSPHHPFPVNVSSDPIWQPHPQPTRFHSVICPPSRQMPIPGEFSPFQLDRLSNGALSYHRINEKIYAQQLNPMQNLPLYHQQEIFGAHDIPNLDLNGANLNHAALNQRLEMKLIAKQMHTHGLAGSSQRKFINHSRHGP